MQDGIHGTTPEGCQAMSSIFNHALSQSFFDSSMTVAVAGRLEQLLHSQTLPVDAAVMGPA